MRLKLDENLGRSTAQLFVDAGHDVAIVRLQRMAGASDTEVYDACTCEGRALVTLDLDFANPLRFDRAAAPGLAVLRVRSYPTMQDLERAAATLVGAFERGSISGQLWIVRGSTAGGTTPARAVTEGSAETELCRPSGRWSWHHLDGVRAGGRHMRFGHHDLGNRSRWCEQKGRGCS